MQATQTDFQTLLTGTKVFLVPIFQRRYKWARKEWNDLWEDLMAQYEHPDVVSGNLKEGEGHFLGSVVLHPAPGPASTVARYLLVDGQQRLTTIMALLAAIRDVRSATEPDWPTEAYDNIYLKNQFKPNDPLRLMPGIADREAFVSTLFEGEPTGQIGNAYLWFRRQLKKLAGTSPIDFDGLERAILLRLLAVEITTSQADNVNHIFHTLNFSGMKLSAVDLIRNFVLMQLSPDVALTAHEKIWLPLEGMLGEGLPRYIYAQLVRVDRKVKQRDIYEPFERRMKGLLEVASDREEAVMREMRRLVSEASLFRFIEDPTTTPEDLVVTPGLRHALRELAAWGASPPVPLVLELLCRLRADESRHDDVVESLRMLLAFLVRRALCGIATNNLNRILSPIPSNLNSEAKFSSQIAKYLGEEPRQWPADEDLFSIGVRSALYRTSRPPQVKFILSRLEWNRDPSEKVDPTQSTIEHIYPQTRSAAWDKYVEGLGYDPDAVSTRTHCIGNLTLTGHNGELGQKSFAAKKTEYANSAYELNRELAGLDNWGIKEIDQRSSLLLTEASRLWSGPPAKQTSAVRAPAIDQADELADALQTVPGDRWVTRDALCDVLALDPDHFEEVLLRVDASLAARVMSADGSIPQWVNETLNHAVREQVLSQGGVLAGKAFADMSVLFADELQSLLQQLGDDDPSAEEMALEGLVP